jgi:hypothetical protein
MEPVENFNPLFKRGVLFFGENRCDNLFFARLLALRYDRLLTRA